MGKKTTHIRISETTYFELLQIKKKFKKNASFDRVIRELMKKGKDGWSDWF